MKKKKDDEEMKAIAMNSKQKRKEKINASFAKLVKTNGKALEKLSKN